MIRVHYFFNTTKNINDMLHSEQIIIRITEGPSWDNPAFEGKSLMLYDFYPDYQLYKTIVLPKVSYIFTSNKKLHMSIQVMFINLQSTIGLTCDGTIESDLYNLYKSNNGFYYTDDFFYSSFPIPSAWINIISKDTREQEQEEETKPYIPILSDRVIVPTLPSKNSFKKFSNTSRPVTCKEPVKIEFIGTTQPMPNKIKTARNYPLKNSKLTTKKNMSKKLVDSIAKDLLDDNSYVSIEKVPIEKVKYEEKAFEESNTNSTYEERVDIMPKLMPNIPISSTKKMVKKPAPKPRQDLKYTGIMFI